MYDYTQPVEVDRIAAVEVPALRNLQITQSYYELASAFVRCLGSCANWCTFATWASKQAGQTIRKEDMLRALQATVADVPDAASAAEILVDRARKVMQGEPDTLHRQIWDLLDLEGGLVRASDAVARGNQKVYAEIGRVFAEFIESCLDDPVPDGQKIAEFTATLRPGDPPDGQEYLRRAFSHYYQALFSSDPKAKAELILLANIEIGFHEQTRLQPEILEALDAALPAPGAYARRVAGMLFPNRGWLLYALWQLRSWLGLSNPLHDAIVRFYTSTHKRLRIFLTEHMMTISLCGLRLPLGRDLKSTFPQQLAQLGNPELLTLLDRVDATPNSLRETGAIDWADLPDRLHFIVDLFRCYQETPALLQPPFTPEQVEAIRAGRLPDGVL